MFEHVKLKELCTVNQGLQIPISKRLKEPGPNRYFYITVQFLKNNIENYYIENPPIATTCNKDEILMVRTGNTGQVITGVEGCFHNNFFKVKPNDRIIPKYLYYVLKSDLMYKRVLNAASGTTIPDLKHSSFYELDIPLPTIETQKKISEMLECIDKKIENNESINRNLEDQAQALFKSYFIDFAPYDGNIADTWDVVTLGDVCSKITDGAHYSPVDVPGAPYPMYSVKDMETYGFNPNSCKHIEDNELQKMKRNDCVPKLNDILVAKDGSYLKEIFICSEEKDEAILSSIAIFRPNTQIIEPEILLYLLKQPSVRKDVGDNYVSGSALPRIVLKDFKKYSFILPPIYEQHKISDVLHSYRMQIKTNVDENMRLSLLRDNLLPKLMSGQMDVTNLDI